MKETAGTRPAAQQSLEAEVVALYQGPDGPSLERVSKALVLSRGRVHKIIQQEGVELRPAGVDGASKERGIYAHEGGVPLRQTRVAAGLSQYELARKANVSQALISGLESEFGFPVGRERAGRIALALEAELETLFTSDRPPAERIGERSQPFAEPTKRWEVRAAEEFAEERKLWTSREAAKYVKVAERTLHAYEEDGLVAHVEERCFGTLPFKFWAPAVIRDFAKSHWSSNDWRAEHFRDEEFIEDWAAKRGLPEDRAEEAVRRAKARALRATQVRQGAHGQEGAAAGIEGGRTGGAPRKWADDEAEQAMLQSEILRLDKLGLSSRDIAEAVFGDRDKKDRVLRFLNA